MPTPSVIRTAVQNDNGLSLRPASLHVPCVQGVGAVAHQRKSDYEFSGAVSTGTHPPNGEIEEPYAGAKINNRTLPTNPGPLTKANVRLPSRCGHSVSSRVADQVCFLTSPGTGRPTLRHKAAKRGSFL